MKTIILYASKHGAAREIARRIADRIPGAEIHDLKAAPIPSVEDFDCIILGSSLYAGKIRNELKSFLSKRATVLQTKRLGLFLSGMDASREQEYFNKNFPSDILKAASAKSFLGGAFHPEDAGFIERHIIESLAKQAGGTSNILDDRIENFTEVMKA